MTYDTIENSIQDSRPTSLYEFRLGTSVWYYTSCEFEQTHNSEVYTPLPIKHTTVNPDGDIAKASITVTVPHDIPLCDSMKVVAPSGVISVTLFEKHIDDVDYRLVWKGRVVNSKWSSHRCDLVVESLITSLRRRVNKLRDSSQCPKTLYKCGVDKELFKVETTAQDVTGLTIYSSDFVAYGENYFSGGYVEWVNTVNGVTESRDITSNSSSGVLLLTSVPYGLTNGTSITAYPGCDRTLETCKNKFNNVNNNGSTKYIPIKNPFNGSTVY